MRATTEHGTRPRRQGETPREFDLGAPVSVFVAAVILAGQGIFAAIWGVGLLAEIETSPLTGFVTLAGSAFALTAAFQLVALRRWSRVGAIALEVMMLAGWLLWGPITPLRAVLGALAATVVALLVTHRDDAACASSAGA